MSRQIGDSPQRKKLFGTATVSKLAITIPTQYDDKGNKIQDEINVKIWNGRNVPLFDWLRNISALTVRSVRYELCTYTHTQVMDHTFIDDNVVKTERLSYAFFSSEYNQNKYDCAARLLPSSIQPGNRVRLTILGCCSIINADKLKNDAETLEDHKMAKNSRSSSGRSSAKRATTTRSAANAAAGRKGAASRSAKKNVRGTRATTAGGGRRSNNITRRRKQENVINNTAAMNSDASNEQQ